MTSRDQPCALAVLAHSITSRGGGWCCAPTDDAEQVAALRPAAYREARRAHLRSELASAQQALVRLGSAQNRLPAYASEGHAYYARRRAELAQHMRDLAAQIGAL
jgi:hypothetical protein